MMLQYLIILSTLPKIAAILTLIAAILTPIFGYRPKKQRYCSMTSKEKQEYAYLLYAKSESISLDEIARRCEVHVNTVSRWKKKNDWDKLRQSMLVTKSEQIKRLYLQLTELNDHIMGKPEGERFANKAEADTLTQITRSIGNLERELTAANVIDVFIPFIQYVAKIDNKQAKLFLKFQDSYIKTLI